MTKHIAAMFKPSCDDHYVEGRADGWTEERTHGCTIDHQWNDARDWKREQVDGTARE